MNALTPNVNRDTAVSALEQVILCGDLSQLSPEQRVHFYNATCESIGLNPLTRPFDYIRLNGREVLYAKKDCTDQLRTIRGVSVQVVDRSIADGLVVVVARATTRDGRSDEDVGAVPLGDKVVGEARANAIMKAMTKAKRRVTLSICGLGFLDESELEGIPAAALAPAGVPQEPRFVPSAPAADAVPVIEPSALVSASAFGLEALDCALADLASVHDLVGYLANPGLRAWLERLRRTRPDEAERADMLIAAARARLDPDSRDEEPAPPWQGMAWPIAARDGSGMEMGDVDIWEAEFERRIVAVERRADLTAEARRHVIQAIAAANRGILAELRERGHGAAVDAVEGFFAEALGVVAA